MARIDAFFRLMNAQGASDLHLASGNLPIPGAGDGVGLTMLSTTDLDQ